MPQLQQKAKKDSPESSKHRAYRQSPSSPTQKMLDGFKTIFDSLHSLDQQSKLLPQPSKSNQHQQSYKQSCKRR